MTTLQVRTDSQFAIEQLQVSRQFLLGLIGTLSEDQLTTKAAGAGNHGAGIL